MLNYCINPENMSLIPFIVLELLMKNAHHSNPVNRGGNDEPPGWK